MYLKTSSLAGGSPRMRVGSSYALPISASALSSETPRSERTSAMTSAEMRRSVEFWLNFIRSAEPVEAQHHLVIVDARDRALHDDIADVEQAGALLDGAEEALERGVRADGREREVHRAHRTR